MQTSNLALAALLLAIPLGAASGCLDPGTCLRNTDCPSIDVCSQGACVLAPIDTPLDGGDEAGEGGTTFDAGGTPDAVSPADATLIDAHTDGSADARADADDASASDADDAGD